MQCSEKQLTDLGSRVTLRLDRGSGRRQLLQREGRHHHRETRLLCAGAALWRHPQTHRQYAGYGHRLHLSAFCTYENTAKQHLPTDNNTVQDTYDAPAPPRPYGGVLSDDVRLTSVCLLRTSGLSREQRGLGRLKLAEVAHVTCDSDHFQGQGVKGQLAGAGAYCGSLPDSLLRKRCFTRR